MKGALTAAVFVIWALLGTVSSARAQFSANVGWGVNGHGGYEVEEVGPTNYSNYVAPSPPPAPRVYLPANVAELIVRVPSPNASVWIQGQTTQAQGSQRTFLSPPLNPDAVYSYMVRATWLDNGRLVTQEKAIAVVAGEISVLNFRRPSPRNETGTWVSVPQ